MVYRAKCTNIMSFIESCMNFNAYHIVYDCQDKYIEVPTEDLASQIELIEKTTVDLNLQKMRLYDLLGIVML